MLLRLFEDNDLFDSFKEQLSKLVNHKGGKFSWKHKFHKILSSRAGSAFFRKIISIVPLKEAEQQSYWQIIEEIKNN